MNPKARIVYKTPKGDVRKGTIQGRYHSGFYVLPDKKKRVIPVSDKDESASCGRFRLAYRQSFGHPEKYRASNLPPATYPRSQVWSRRRPPLWIQIF